jgi:hypothetical protein
MTEKSSQKVATNFLVGPSDFYVTERSLASNQISRL